MSRKFQEASAELDRLYVKHLTVGLTREESSEGLRLARVIIGIIAERGTSSRSLQRDIFSVVNALEFKACVAKMDGCHKDAHECYHFVSCYVRCHVVSPGEIPREVTSEVLKGRVCYEGVECSLNLDMPGRRRKQDEVFHDPAEAMAVYADACDDTACFGRAR